MSTFGPGILALFTLSTACTGRPRAADLDVAAIAYQVELPAGVDPTQLRLAFPGADFVEIERSGDLVLHAGSRSTRRHGPRAYQDLGGQRREIDARFALDKNGDLRVKVGPYDPRHPVVIDPLLK
jgi:hypothetical protein